MLKLTVARPSPTRSRFTSWLTTKSRSSRAHSEGTMPWPGTPSRVPALPQKRWTETPNLGSILKSREALLLTSMSFMKSSTAISPKISRRCRKGIWDLSWWWTLLWLISRTPMPTATAYLYWRRVRKSTSKSLTLKRCLVRSKLWG